MSCASRWRISCAVWSRGAVSPQAREVTSGHALPSHRRLARGKEPPGRTPRRGASRRCFRNRGPRAQGRGRSRRGRPLRYRLTRPGGGGDRLSRPPRSRSSASERVVVIGKPRQSQAALEAVEPLMRLRNIHVLAKVTARRGRCRPQDHGQDPSPAALGGHPGLQQHRWQAPQEARLRTSRRQQDALQRLRSRSRPPVPVHPVGPEAIRVPRAARHQRGHEEARDDRAVQECGRQVGPGRHPGVRPRYDHDSRTDAIGVAMCG